MKSNCDILGKYIQLVDTRNKDLAITNLLGVSIEKKFIPSIANIVGTDLSSYKVVRTSQFAYGPVTSRNGEKISIAYLDGEDCIISSSYSVFEVTNKEALDPEYLMLWFSRPEFDRYARYKSHGSVREIFDWNELCMVELPMPSIDAQRNIVKAYKTITDRIVLKKQINYNLEQQVSALYQAWFEEYIKSDGTKLETWSFATLSDIAEVNSGKRPPVKSSKKTDGTQIPLVGAASIMGFTSEANHTERILVTGRVGTHGVIQRFNIPCWTSDNTLVITSKYYEYVCQILKRIDYASINRGSTQPLITQGDMNKVAVLLPDEHTLNEFEKLAGILMAQYEANLIENNSLANIRDALLPKIMSGELDVSNVEF